jgi:hypothetical protein
MLFLQLLDPQQQPRNLKHRIVDTHHAWPVPVS